MAARALSNVMDTTKCRFKSATCHSCEKLGHIKAVCRSTPAKDQRPQHQAQVHVTGLGGQAADHPLIVVQTDGPSLPGRNWLQKIQLDWQEIHRLYDRPVDRVLDRHSEVFQDELGTLKGFQAKIHIDPSVTPRF